MTNDCLFCKIASGEIPSKKIYEDADCIAFLDINPANPGHALVAPRQHSENIYDVPENDLKKLIIAVKKVAMNVKEKLNAQGMNIMQNNGRHAGQLVNHIHFHVIPRFENDSVVISYKRTPLTENQLEEVQKRLVGEKPAAKESTDRFDRRIKDLEMEL